MVLNLAYDLTVKVVGNHLALILLDIILSQLSKAVMTAYCSIMFALNVS